MPEYLSPGVYVEEIDKGPKPIEGVGTAMACFVGFTEKASMVERSNGDLLIVHGPNLEVTATAEKVWYPIWDVKLRLDHSVRSVKEAVSVAREDLKTALTLLDGRVIAGDDHLGAAALARVKESWINDARRRLPERRRG